MRAAAAFLFCLAPFACACTVLPGTVLRIALEGDEVAVGILNRPAYSGTCLALDEGLRVRIGGGRLEKHPAPAFWLWTLRVAALRELSPSGTLRDVHVGPLRPVRAGQRRVEAAGRGSAQRVVLVRTRS